ncbi:MAG: UDPGP type 1 family protein, partial [Planctomycetota bacterium]
DDGNIVNPEGKNGIKFETFVFDALSLAEKSVTLEVLRQDEFSPVKNAEGVDSPATTRRDLTALALRILEGAGATIERNQGGEFDGVVELSPLSALDASDLEGKVSSETVVRDGFSL